MKFKEKYRQDILLAFSDHNIEKPDISFSKRKGRIIINHKSGSTFSFYENLDFDIDVRTRERIETSEFELKINGGDKQFIKNWSDVLIKLKSWVHSLL